MGGFFVGAPQNLGVNTFVLRRVRPTLEGTLFDRFGFRIVPDFGNGQTVLQDAYINARFVPELQLSLALTGEKTSYKGIKPKNPINSKEGKWGGATSGNRQTERAILSRFELAF